MSSFSRFTEGSAPLAWWRGHPIYLSAYLALFTIGSMVLTALLGGFAPETVGHLVYSHENFWGQFKFWTPLTHLLINPVSIFTLLTAFMWWKFGSEVENYLGRRTYLKLLGVILGTTLLTTSLVALMGQSRPLASVFFLEWSVFVAFATLYAHARVSIFVATLSVRILAAIFLALGVLQAVSSQNWVLLAQYLTVTGAAIAFITHWQGRWRVVMKPTDQAAPFAQPPSPRTSPQKKTKNRAFTGSVDDLLDKISQQGMQSLSDEERDFLHQQSRKMADKKD